MHGTIDDQSGTRSCLGKLHILRRTTPSKASVSGNKKAVCAWMADEFDHLADVS